jgi:hypothetical protein
MAHVKWLHEITVIDTPFTGFQQAVAYRFRQRPEEDGDPVTLINPRALMIPPGFPDFMSRERIVRPGPVALEGRAWSGRAPITSVEVTVDDGRTWNAAEPGPATAHRWAWRAWRFDWTAEPGTYHLAARATDAEGGTQPLRQRWNRGGFADNMIQRIPVHCLPLETEAVGHGRR